MLEQLANEMGIDGGVERCVNTLMNEDNERLLMAAIQFLRNEGVGVEQDGVGCAWFFFILDVLIRRTGVLRLVDVGDIADLLVPEQIVHTFQYDIGVVVRWRESGCR